MNDMSYFRCRINYALGFLICSDYMGWTGEIILVVASGKWRTTPSALTGR
jgi:hypothetical protein